MKPIRPDLTVDRPPLPAPKKQAASAPKSMDDRPNHRVLHGGVLLAAGSMLALACAAATFEPWPEPDSAHRSCCEPPPRASVKSWPQPGMSADEAVVSAAAGGQQQQRPGADADDELDPLRNGAAMGDADSAVQLAQELVDRFETNQSRDDLFEAVLWIDRFRGNESMARSGVIAEVSLRHCDAKALRHHWLCVDRRASGRLGD